MRKGLGRKATAYVLWGMAAAFGSIAYLTCCASFTFATQVIWASAAIWLLSLVVFLRIPASDE